MFSKNTIKPLDSLNLIFCFNVLKPYFYIAVDVYILKSKILMD